MGFEAMASKAVASAVASAGEKVGAGAAVLIGAGTVFGRAMDWINTNQGLIGALGVIVGLLMQFVFGQYRNRRKAKQDDRLYDLEKRESEARIAIEQEALAMERERHAAEMRRLNDGRD